MKKCLGIGIFAAIAGAATGIASAQVAKEPVGSVKAQVAPAAPATDEKIASAIVQPMQRADDPIYDSIHYQGTPGGGDSQPRGGAPSCAANPNDLNNCTTVDVTLGANFSAQGSFITADNFVPLTSPITSICWLGRYLNRTAPPSANEMFRIRIFNDSGGLPNTSSVVFDGTFQQNGTQGVDDLDGPQFYDPTMAGGPGPLPMAAEYTYSVTDLNIAVTPNNCYWVEIRNLTVVDLASNWGWCGSQGGRDIVSYQSLSGTYTAGDQVANDRAFCMGTGLDNFTAGLCPDPPPVPPVCTNDPANGQAFVAAVLTGGFSSSPNSVTLPVCGAAACPTLQIADSFQLASGGDITHICFWGFWRNATNSAQVAGPADQGVDITYYTNNPINGTPNTVIATFRVGVSAGVTLDQDGFQYGVHHPAVNIPANTCFQVSISYQIDANNPARAFYWLTGMTNAGAVGNNQIHFRAANVPNPGCWATGAFGGAGGPAVSNQYTLFNIGPAVPTTCVPPAPPPPANDLCANATTLTGLGSFAYDARGALSDGAANEICDGGATPVGNDAWFNWTAPCDGSITVTNCGSCGSDTVLAAYQGSTCPTGAALTCGDDNCAAVGGPSSVTFNATSGTAYKIRLGTFQSGPNGVGVLTISRAGGNCPVSCPCNWNGIPPVNSQDFFDFLNDFFMGDADYNGMNGTNSQDFFDFLGCFFNLPPGCL